MKTTEIKKTIIENFIDHYTTDEAERENMKKIANTYVDDDHVDEIGQAFPETIKTVIQKRIDKAMNILSNDRSEIEDIIIPLDQYVKDGNDIENLLDYFSDEIEVSERYEYEFSIKDFLNAISID